MKPQAILAMVLGPRPGRRAVAAPTPASPPAAAAQAPNELNGFPNRDGPLTAMLLIIPEAELAEFDKPFDQAPRLSLLHSARVGETVALKILFTSPQRDADGMIDLTYDVKIIGPTECPMGMNTPAWRRSVTKSARTAPCSTTSGRFSSCRLSRAMPAASTGLSSCCTTTTATGTFR